MDALPRRAARLAVVVLLTAACNGTGPQHVDIGGTWQGTAALPEAYATTLTVIQSGTTISGGIEIAGLLDETFAGTFHENVLTVSWSTQSGCEDWSGTFTVDPESSEMSGPVTADRSRCGSSATDLGGSITLSRR